MRDLRLRAQHSQVRPWIQLLGDRRQCPEVRRGLSKKNVQGALVHIVFRWVLHGLPSECFTHRCSNEALYNACLR